jgi:predicted nuclease of restriction endonuclease-like RecB superfamily
MALSLKDVRFTTRRAAAADDLPVIYPRLLRDRSTLPKIEIAIRYFESMVGHERREFDAEVLVQFFGDHKLARCIVACLARSYRFRAPRIAEIVTPAALRRLDRAGLASSQALRIHLFDHVNTAGDGFVRGLEREPVFGRIERKIGVRHGELDRLITLDSEEHHILTRTGAAPAAEDVVAEYNLQIILAALRHAERVDLSLRNWSSEAEAGFDTIRRLLDVDAPHPPAPSRHPLRGSPGGEGEPSPSEAGVRSGGATHLTLRGRQDALGVWSRHGRKVARALVLLLERDRAAVDEGTAALALKDRRATLRLTSEVLDILAGSSKPPAGWTDTPGWDAETIQEALQTWHRTAVGWSVRRWPDAQAWAAGVVVPDLLLEGEGHRCLVCAVRSADHATRLAAAASHATTGDPLLFAGPDSSLAPLYAAGATVVAQEALDLDALVHRARSLAPREPDTAATSRSRGVRRSA